MTTDIKITESQGILGHLTYYAIDGQGNVLGFLELCDQRPGLNGRLIRHIEINPEHRRKGLATKLWDHAKATGINPVHAIDKTPEGSAWAKAVGD